MGAAGSTQSLIDKTLGHFRVVAEVGRGGMGVVFLAEDEKLGRSVALKVLREEVAFDAGRRARFLREARAAAAVTHPNIAAIYESGESAEGVYLAMELVEGKPLRALLDGSPLPLAELLTIARGVASALAKAHDKGVIHRDLKPENILVTPEGQPKVVDFGLAKISRADDELVSGDAETVAEVSREGAFVGTPAYASPEQARGLAVDHRTDLFSFGVVLYELATGARPFRGPTEMDVLVALMSSEPRPPRSASADVPEWLERVILKCLAKDPAGRYPSAHELVRDLAGETAPRPPARPTGGASGPDRKSELILIERVREFWIDGVLRHATKDEALLELTKDERLGAVDRGFELTAPRLDEDESPIDERVTIAEYFDRRGAALLILGEPGSGKTVTLLELARDLVARADRDPDVPIPVVLSLATFRDPKTPIASWIVEQLREGYRIPEKVGRVWVESDRLALLLDGLDEVTPSLVGEAVAGLNRFRDEHGFVPIAVACRRTDYEALGTRLKLGAAIQLRALTDAQVDGAIAAAGPRLAPLADALATDAELRELSHSPLMLNIMSLSYEESGPDRDGDRGRQRARPDTADRRTALFERYVTKMLARREGRLPASPERTLRSLRWLARNMKARSETVFALEELQPASLPPGRFRLAYFAATRLLVAALFANVITVNGTSPGFRLILLAGIFLPLLFFDYRLGKAPHLAPRSWTRRAADFAILTTVMATTTTGIFLVEIVRDAQRAPTASDAGKAVAIAVILTAPIVITLARRRGRLAAGRDVTTVESLRIRWRKLAIAALLLGLGPAIGLWYPYRNVDAGSVRTFDSELGTARSAETRATSAAFTAGGHVALLGRGEAPVVAFDVDTGHAVDTALVGRVAIDPTGRFVATSDDDRHRDVVVADAVTFANRRVVALPEDLPRRSVEDVGFGRDGALLVGGERSSALFDPGSGALVRSFAGHARFASDGRHLILSTPSGDTKIVTREGDVAADLAFLGNTQSVAARVDVEPGGRWVLGSRGPCVFRVDLGHRAEPVAVPLAGCSQGTPEPRAESPRPWFSRDGSLVVVATKDELVFLDRDLVVRGVAHQRVEEVSISNDGASVLVSAGGRLALYRGADAAEVASFADDRPTAPWTTSGARMSDDGQRVLTFASAPPSAGVGAIVGFFGLLIALGISLETGVVRLKTQVNEGIRRTLRRALAIGLATATLVGTTAYLITMASVSVGDALGALVLGLSVGAAFGLGFGGLDLVHHYALRLLLAARKELPLRAATLLDSAVQLIVLRRVGGGYMFIHRLVLEHFADEPVPSKGAARREG